MDFPNLSAAATSAFLISVFLMVALRPLAKALGWVDKPGGRKTHVGEVPVIGGLAMYAGLLVAAGFRARLGEDGIAVLACAGLMVLVGALDDRFDLSPYARLVAHLAAAISIVVGTGFVVSDLGDLLGIGTLKLGAFAPVFTVLACIALINAFNMLDGLDGLAGGAGLLAFVGLAILAIGAGAPVSSTVSVSMAAAIAAFLFFNVPALFNRPVRAFMGDAGSTLLGFVLACVSLTMVQPERAGIPPVLVLWLMPIPILELFSSTFRRLARGQSPLHADANHFHHVLLRARLSVRNIFVLYFAVSGLSVAMGIMGYRLGLNEATLFAGFIGFGALWLLFLRHAERLVPILVRGAPVWQEAAVGTEEDRRST
jgi:UDP-GlcNAc:undecaprenyl-phosphate GlcNAc-1-phosphate transferase